MTAAKTAQPAKRRTRRAPAAKRAPADPCDRAMHDFRDRMRAVGQLIRDGFGLGDDLDAGRVNHDACRLVMSLIIETLVTADERVPTAELGAVSRIIAEQRKLDPDRRDAGDRKNAHKVSGGDTLDRTGPRPLPASFSRVVDQIYGTSLAEQDTTPTPDDA